MSVKDLPIFSHRSTILKSIQTSTATVLTGMTGCGKSTQVPQYIYQTHPSAVIAVCEPRRLAAVSLAMRVSDEMGCRVGSSVGYQIGMESKKANDTKICYMTYGILIQQLLHNNKIPYTHIILDQVHERSLDMDFTFVIIKKILEQPANRHIKVIIMSATLSAEDFSFYFAKDLSNQHKMFISPTLKYGISQIPSRRRDRPPLQALKIQIQYPHQSDYQICQCITLPQNSIYKVQQYFANQIPYISKIANYHGNEDIRIPEQVYTGAIKIMQHKIKTTDGDILVFVPGMRQIKKLKQSILCGMQIDEENIIQVHSAFSQNLYQKLFDRKSQTKIIISTNIGESSITLPMCKVVIDFCLNRKNMVVQTKGFSRFETRLASKSNLIQRKGRVGRTSNGQVYRLISREQYNQLDEFDIPEIQCVTLEMTILKLKQLDKTSNSNIFADPYEILMNTLEPPEVNEIHKAIKNLLFEGALVDQSSGPSGLKFEGEKIKITKLGQFMAAMPCHLLISKMLVFSKILGIQKTMAQVAAILMSSKNFFTHTDKLENTQDFIHYLILYDEGNYNDFILRQKIFQHWKVKFFDSFLKNKRPSNEEKQNQKYNQPHIMREKKQNGGYDVVGEFEEKRVNKMEWKWCKERGTTPYIMRDILKNLQNLRQRLSKYGIHFNLLGKENADNELILLCLMMAFGETETYINFSVNNGNMNKDVNYVNSVTIDGGSDFNCKQNIKKYLKPIHQNQYQIVQNGFGRIQVFGPPVVLSKLLLPHCYKNNNFHQTTETFQWLSSLPRNSISYTFDQPPDMGLRIGNQSINRITLRPDPNKVYRLICENIVQSHYSKFARTTALIDDDWRIIMKMILCKNVSLQPHGSGQFYQATYIDDLSYTLAFEMTEEMLKIINSMRKYLDFQKFFTQQHFPQISRSLKQNFINLLKCPRSRLNFDDWNKKYDEEIEGYQIQPIIAIEEAKVLVLNKNSNYFQRYQQWKINYYYNLHYDYNIFNYSTPNFMCAQCWPVCPVQLFQFSSFDLNNKVFRRIYCSDQDQCYFCPNGHCIGDIIHNFEDNQKAVAVDFNKVLIGCPFDSTINFTGDRQIFKYFEKWRQIGEDQTEKEREQIELFKCRICMQQIKRSKEQDDFWPAIKQHIKGKQHTKLEKQFLGKSFYY